MALQRRTFVRAIAGVGVGLAGCSGIGGTNGTNTGTPTDSVHLGPEPRDIHVVIHNDLSQTITAAVELSTERTVLVDDEETIEPHGITSFDSGIDETGHYYLVVSADDREKEITFEMDEYDLEMGSNIIFWIDEDDIRYGIED